MTTLTDTQVITASGGLVELGYKATISGSHSITQTGASRYSLMSSPLSVVCDGSPVLVEVFLAGARPDLGAGNRQLYVGLYIDGVEVFTQFGLFITPAAGDVYRPSPISYRYTPTAGAHTFEVKASVDAGAGYIEGGSGTRPPSYIRVSKIVQATQWPAVTTGTIICTSSTRPASPFAGQQIWETDTSKGYTYTGSAWIQTAPAPRRLAYVERTTDYTVSASSVATASNVFSSNATFTADGTSAYRVVYESPIGISSTNNGGRIEVALVDGSGSAIRYLAQIGDGNGTNSARTPIHAVFYYTPSSGSVSLNIRGMTNGGNGALYAGGTGGWAPQFLAVYGPELT